MQTLLLVVCLLAAAVHPQPTLDSPHPIGRDLGLWKIYKVKYGKKYGSAKEDNERRKIFLNNLAFVRKHNTKYKRGEVTFDVEINKFADLSLTEFAQTMNNFKIPQKWPPSGKVFKKLEGQELPPSVNWTERGAVTPVIDQGACGSCWAISATGSLEGRTFLKTKRLIPLSIQNLLDCSYAEGNEGCKGGRIYKAFNYIINNKGIDTEDSYPYEAGDGPCRYDPGNIGSTTNSYVKITPGRESDLQAAVGTEGPISIAIDANHTSFQLYSSGVYNETKCSSCHLNHDVLLVGYGNVTLGGAYWLVRNSYGTDWGMQGYIMIAKNQGNMCGVASEASFPNV